MISTKRQIRKDDDRYGGFGMDNVGAPLVSEYDRIDNASVSSRYGAGTSLIMSDTDIDIKNEPYARQQDIEQTYTTLDRAGVRTEAPADIPPRPKKKEVPHSREDVLPTLKTRSYATEQAQAEVKEEPAEAPAKRVRRGLDSRAKIMLCVYVAVALVLAIAVIATGVSISQASVASDELTLQIAQKQTVIAEQETTLAALRDADNIREKAAANGMVQAGESVYDAPAAADVGYPEAEPHTNGFDKFLDWLSKVIG